MGRLVLTALLIAVSAVGCNRPGPENPPSPVSPPFKGFTDPGTILYDFDHEKKDKRVPGIDDVHLAYLQWCDDGSRRENPRMALAVWTDVNDPTFSAPCSPPKSEGEMGEFNFHLGKDKTLVITCRTADGRTGSVSVTHKSGTADFELSRGWLILVSTAGGQLRTKQLKPLAIQWTPKQAGGDEEYQKLRGDREVAAFFAKET